MKHSDNIAKTVFAGVAFLGGTLGYAAVAHAQIDFSVLDKWKVPGAQRGEMARPPDRSESNRKDPSEPQRREPSPKEIQKAREQADRLIATVRGKLIRPVANVPVTFRQRWIPVPGTSGFFNTPPTPAGILAAVAGGTKETPATSITPLALKRGAAILARAISKDESEETSAFLAGEAAVALQGGRLRVHVDDAAFKWRDRQEAQFRSLLQEAEDSYKDVELAKSERVRVDAEIVSIAEAVQNGSLSAAQGETRKKALSDALEAALARSTAAQKKIRDLPAKMKTVIEVRQ